MNSASHNFSESKVIEVALNNIVDVLNSQYPKIFYFTASWCGPCKKIKPYYDELSTEYPMIKFYKVDIDKHTKLASSFSVTSVPAFFFMKNANEYETLTGADPVKLDIEVRRLKNNLFNYA